MLPWEILKTDVISDIQNQSVLIAVNSSQLLHQKERLC